jgi:hypothetical protein
MKGSPKPNTSLTDEITLIVYNFLDMISLSLDRTIYEKGILDISN